MKRRVISKPRRKVDGGTCIAVLLLLGLLAGDPLLAESGEPTVRVVTSGLSFPTGISVRPDTGDIFVSESGLGRVVAIDGGRVNVVLDQFPRNSVAWLGEEPLGPLGLHFMTRDLMAVAFDDASDEGERRGYVQFFDLAQRESWKPDGDLYSDASTSRLGPIEVQGVRETGTLAAVGNIVSLMSVYSDIYVASSGDSAHAGVAFGRYIEGESQPLVRFRRTVQDLGAEAVPTALTISPDGHLVITGIRTGNGPNRILFYHARGGKRLLRLDIDLAHVVALAYSPNRELLYALNRRPEVAATRLDRDGRVSGLYRIDGAFEANKVVARTTLVVPLPAPCAMAFTPDGDLLVTSSDQGDVGTSEAVADEPRGAVLGVANFEK